MENSYFWERFEHSGNIADYLKYTACTKENVLNGTSDSKEGRRGGFTDYGNRNGVGCHAGWRL